jgi:tetratricopeptide (TPR) repeat protein
LILIGIIKKSFYYLSAHFKKKLKTLQINGLLKVKRGRNTVKTQNTFYKHLAIIIFIIILTLSNFGQPAVAQQKPLTFNQLLNFLQSKKDKLNFTQKKEIIIKAVKERGIDFKLVNSQAFQLLTVGADKEIINILKSLTQDKPNVNAELKDKKVVNSPTTNNFVAKVSNATKIIPEDPFEREIGEGNKARDERNYGDSEAAYRRAWRLNPRDLRAVYGLGNILSDQQRWEEAEKAYRQAIEIDSKDTQTYIALIFVLLQPIEMADTQKRYAEAEKLARKVIQLEPDNAFAYLELGTSLQMQGQVGKETESAYEKVIQLDPKFGLAYAYLGNLLKKRGMDNESAAAYSNAVRLASDVPSMILVADIFESQQHNTQSQILLKKALAEDPNNLTALLILGRILIKDGNFKEAEKILKRSVDVSPGNYVSYLLLVSLYSLNKNYLEIEETLLLASEAVSPNDKKRLGKEFEALGDNLMRIGKRKDAARVYRQSILLTSEKIELNDKLINAEGIR